MPTSGDVNGAEPVRMAIVGTGAIGRVHARVANDLAEVDLCGLSGLDDGAAELATDVGAEFVRDYRDLTKLNVDAVIVAAPNQLHLEMARFFAEHGIHLLMEKPLAETRAAGAEICRVTKQNGVELLVGHHRRHHSLVKAAQRFVSMELGDLVATNTLVTMQKPDSYYEVEWRRSEGAGPLLVNLIHEVDLLRAVCGEIEAVQSVATKANRRFAFDDTATMLFRYVNGALGTLLISESTPSPWSWEASVSDGMGFHNAGQDHGQFLGTTGSLGFPSLTAWRYDQGDPDPGWNSALHATRLNTTRNNPYVAQIQHFARVAKGFETPLVTGEDGLRSLAVVDAVIEAAATGKVVTIDKLLVEF